MSVELVRTVMDAFSLDRYVVRRRWWPLASKLDVFHQRNEQVAYAEEANFLSMERAIRVVDETKEYRVTARLPRPICLFADERKKTLLVTIKTDASSLDTYVIDSRTEKRVAGLSWREMWLLLDDAGRKIGQLKQQQADSKFQITLGGSSHGTIERLHGSECVVDLTTDFGRRLDRRLALVAAILLLAVRVRMVGD